MVGVFSSMLNVFLPFTNTFLLCLFFLAWLIPQLLQKSQKYVPPATVVAGGADLRIEIYLKRMMMGWTGGVALGIRVATSAALSHPRTPVKVST